MKAYQIGDQSGLQALHLAEMPDPVAGPGEVIVAPRLVSLNNRDLQILRGTYSNNRKMPNRVPAGEGVGIIESVGEGVTDFAPGDRVIANHFVNWVDGPFGYHAFGYDLAVSHDGWLAEKVMIPARALVKVPDFMIDEQVAPLASAGVTAWNAISVVGKVQPGQLVLCLGTGGVAIFALQIAKALGARVAITSSSDDKLALARRLGADYTINYRTSPDWAAELMAQTNGAGADLILETGGPGTLGQSVAAAAVGGTIVIIGVTQGPGTPLPNYGTIIGKNLTLRGIAAGSREMLVNLLDKVAEAGVVPVINKVFDFDQAPEAFEYLDRGDHSGKVLIKL